MTDKTQLEMIRGAEADLLLKNELLIEAFDKVHQDIVTAMESAPMGDEKTHNRLVIALQLLKKIKKNIEDVVTTGKLARLQVKETAGDKIKKFVRG